MASKYRNLQLPIVKTILIDHNQVMVGFGKAPPSIVLTLSYQRLRAHCLETSIAIAGERQLCQYLVRNSLKTLVCLIYRPSITST